MKGWVPLRTAATVTARPMARRQLLVVQVALRPQINIAHPPMASLGIYDVTFNMPWCHYFCTNENTEYPVQSLGTNQWQRQGTTKASRHSTTHEALFSSFAKLAKTIPPNLAYFHFPMGEEIFFEMARLYSYIVLVHLSNILAIGFMNNCW